MKRRAMLCGTIILSGCASPQISSYRLAPVAGLVRGGASLRIGVRSIGLPADLAQNGLPRPGGLYAANHFVNDVWAAPLADMLQNVMVRNLAQRLPGDSVLEAGGAIGAAPDIYAEIDVFSFTPDETGTITLQAQLALRHAAAQDWRLRNFTASQPSGTMAENIASAMSALWGQAADALADMVQTL